MFAIPAGHDEMPLELSVAFTMNETKRPTGGTKDDLCALILIVAAFSRSYCWLSIDLAREQDIQIRFAE
ncbi:MAG: hypothetical protein Q8O42_08985 [Acidobacteriota bacterium]|nr:hypothetical protein [Acidobacteriota bacterium]